MAAVTASSMVRAAIAAFAVLSAAALLAPQSARANDSSAALGLGGITLQQNDDISLDAEELIISRRRVTVRYRFTNHSAHDIETLVAFPLPAVPDEITGHMGDRGMPDWKELDFVTRVDGVEVPLERVDSVTVAGRPVDARLKELGWPAHWFQDHEFLQSLGKLPEAERDALVSEGLLRARQGWPGNVQPAWTISTSITRRQVFPAGRTVSVEHSYVPVYGSSVAGSLEPRYRQEALPHYVSEFCVDQAFFEAFDQTYRQRAEAAQSEWAVHVEVFVRYILSSGANWRGPIRDFRLVIQKEDPDTLMSVCMPGGRQISPTETEYRLTDFEPERDLHIVFVEWAPSS